MSNEQDGPVSETRKSNWGKLIIMNAAVAAWLIYDMATASEAPRQAVAILQYVLLPCALLGLTGSVVKYLSKK
jgi:hypothetical protein